MVVFVLTMTLAPLLVFGPRLLRTRSKGLSDYGTLAGQHLREFDQKWLRNSAALSKSKLGSSDIQALAALNSGYNLIRAMRPSLITRELAIRMVLATLLPAAPLLLTMMSIEELAKKLGEMLL